MKGIPVFLCTADGKLHEAEAKRLGAAGVRGAAPVALEVRLCVRGPIRGEPVRLSVTAPEPVEPPHAVFLGHDVQFLREDVEGRRWSAWSAIGLDQPVVSARIEVRARTADGRDAFGTARLRMKRHDFPEERLNVAEEYVEPRPELQSRIAAEQRLVQGVYARRTVLPSLDRPFVRPVPGDASSPFGTRRRQSVTSSGRSSTSSTIRWTSGWFTPTA